MGLDVSLERIHRDGYRWENEHVHGNRCLLSIRLSGLLQHDCVEAVYLAGVAQAIADGVGVQVDAARRLPEIVNVVESRAAERCDWQYSDSVTRRRDCCCLVLSCHEETYDRNREERGNERTPRGYSVQVVKLHAIIWCHCVNWKMIFDDDER